MNPNPAGLDRCLGLGPPRHWGGGGTPQAAEYRLGSGSSGNKIFVEDLGSFFFFLSYLQVLTQVNLHLFIKISFPIENIHLQESHSC